VFAGTGAGGPFGALTKPVSDPKVKLILHLVGDVPPLIRCHAGDQLSVIAPATLA